MLEQFFFNGEEISKIEELESKIAPFSMVEQSSSGFLELEFNQHMGMGSHSGFLDQELGSFDFYSEHSGAGFLE